MFGCTVYIVWSIRDLRGRVMSSASTAARSLEHEHGGAFVSYGATAGPGLLLSIERASLTAPVLIGGLVFLLAVAGVLCWVLNSPQRTSRLARLIRAVRQK